jgi:ADP-heptose:LPS heptosyltransferase
MKTPRLDALRRQREAEAERQEEALAKAAAVDKRADTVVGVDRSPVHKVAAVDRTPVHEVAVDTSSSPSVDTSPSVDASGVDRRKSYKAEWMRRRRAAERAMKAASEGSPPC